MTYGRLTYFSSAASMTAVTVVPSRSDLLRAAFHTSSGMRTARSGVSAIEVLTDDDSAATSNKPLISLNALLATPCSQMNAMNAPIDSDGVGQSLAAVFVRAVTVNVAHVDSLNWLAVADVVSMPSVYTAVNSLSTKMLGRVS